MSALTVTEALKVDEPRTLDYIFPGSWIDANFDVWIGAPEDNRAWEFLLRARQKYDELAPALPEDDRRLAHEELMIAEGSDWCWWYGPEHQSDNRREFDQLYREHLAGVYRALKLAPPEELSRPILMTEVSDTRVPPVNRIHPVIDGEVTSYFEWMGAGHYGVDIRSGSMHGERAPVRDLYYGVDESNLYLRLDFDKATFTGVEMRTEQRVISLLDNPDVESAQKRILEIRIPFGVIGAIGDQTLRCQVALTNDGIPLDVIPSEGWLEVFCGVAE
jgi:hypothetical protein